MISIKRVYVSPEPADGTRVLVDRLWPRGVSREAARIDEWAKAIAPSSELRKWYGHEPARWDAFQQRYRAELDSAEAAAELARLARLARDGALTLITATRAEHRTHADVLKALIEAADRAA